MLKTCILVVSLFLSANVLAADTGYHVINRLKLGGEGGWDYLTVDAPARRLYVSRSSHVMVVDLTTGKIAGDIPNTLGVHGIAVAPELNRGFTSNGKANTSTIFDLKTLKLLGEVKTGANPDAILYDPAAKTVFTFNGRSKDATVFEAASGKIVATIPLGGKPEYAAANGLGKIYVNIEDTNEVVEIDTAINRVSRRVSLAPCDEPTGMGIDVEHGRVYSGCHNKIMAVVDTTSGKMIATLPIGDKVDGNGFDAGTGLAFSANGDGTLTVAKETEPGIFKVLENVTTQPGSRTMAVDPVTHYVYLPAAKFTPAKATSTEQKPRPEMVSGSFELLIVGK